MLSSKTTYSSIGNLKVRIDSEIVEDKTMDTRISIIEVGTLCFISGESIDSFMSEINMIVSKHRI